MYKLDHLSKYCKIWISNEVPGMREGDLEALVRVLSQAMAFNLIFKTNAMHFRPSRGMS